MSFRTPDEVRASFDALRLVTDPRGHDLLAELERLALCENAMLALHQRMLSVATGDEVDASPVFPENGHARIGTPAAVAATPLHPDVMLHGDNYSPTLAYPADDPKSNGWHGRMADVYDLRDRG